MCSGGAIGRPREIWVVAMASFSFAGPMAVAVDESLLFPRRERTNVNGSEPISPLIAKRISTFRSGAQAGEWAGPVFAEISLLSPREYSSQAEIKTL